MSIASELNALNGYILGAYDEISTMGGTVPANKNMSNLATAIASIPTGGGGGEFMIGDYHVISGTTTVASTTGTIYVMTYSDFMTAVGGTMPSRVAFGIFDPDAAYGMTGFAYKFGFKGNNTSPHYGNGGDITRGSMSVGVSIDTTNGVYTVGYTYNNAGQFQAGRTYVWFILWK